MRRLVSGNGSTQGAAPDRPTCVQASPHCRVGKSAQSPGFGRDRQPEGCGTEALPSRGDIIARPAQPEPRVCGPGPTAQIPAPPFRQRSPNRHIRGCRQSEQDRVGGIFRAQFCRGIDGRRSTACQEPVHSPLAFHRVKLFKAAECTEVLSLSSRCACPRHRPQITLGCADTLNGRAASPYCFDQHRGRLRGSVAHFRKIG